MKRLDKVIMWGCKLKEIDPSEVWNCLENGICITAIYPTLRNTVDKCKFTPKRMTSKLALCEDSDHAVLVPRHKYLDYLLTCPNVKYFQVIKG